MKLALIVDKSEAYLAHCREKVLTEWGVSNEDIKKITRIGEAGGVTLFGGGTTSILRIDTPEEIKEFIKDCNKLIDNDDFSNKIKDGLIVITTANKNSTKTLEALITKLEGKLFVTKANTNGSTSKSVISELNLNPSSKEFLLSYVGNDYEALVPIVNTISVLNKEQQYKITEEDLYLRIPQKPGSVPPWEIDKPLFSRNVDETISIFRRIESSSHFLIVLSLLKNKFQLSFRAMALIADNPKITETQISKVLGVNKSYALTVAITNARKLGLDRCEEIVQLIDDTERKVKGESRADKKALMEKMLIEIILLLNG